jgi:hypothetical protein
MAAADGGDGAVSIPVGTARSFAASSRSTTSSGRSRVARSTSLNGRCSRSSRPHADVARQSFVGSKRFEHPRHAAPQAPRFRIDLQLHRSLRDKFTSMAAVAPQILRSFHTIS